MFRNIYAILVFIVLASLSAVAYGQDAQVQGQVLDTTGAGVAKALVRVVDQQTSTERKIETNDTGQYTVTGLAPGAYKIVVEASGFSSAVSNQITLNAGQNAVFDFTLKVGATSADVIVTAEKKEERLQDVPVPVTVLDGDDLAKNNQTKIEDFLASVPGLSVARNGQSSPGAVLEIRGLQTTAYQNLGAPTIGFMIDGMPFGPSQLIGYPNANIGFPDIDPSDIDRIEVLKGPQGTLYGADSIGGLVNIVTKDPSTEGVVGHIQVLGEDVPDGATGYAVRGALNVPLSKNLAIRVSAFDRHDPGYIENVTTSQKNVNSADAYGAHIALLYKPINNLWFKFSALLQDDHGYGNSEINVNQNLVRQLGDLQMTGLRGAGVNLYRARVYTGSMNAKLAGVDVVSTTSYNVERGVHNFDDTKLFGPFVDKYFKSTAPNAASFPGDYTNYKFSQETRFSSSYSHWLDWILGSFYTHESNSGYTNVNANDPVTGAIIGSYYTETSGRYGQPPTTLSEEAAFGDLTAHLTQRLNIQFGGRYSWYRQAFNEMLFGPGYVDFGGTLAPEPVAARRGSDQAFTYLITPSYKFSPDLMAYARIATGYQIGGTNDANSPTLTYGPSKTTNYEIGTKGTLAHRRLVFDASAYYIDWKDMQVGVVYAFVGYTTNAGRAKSQGIECSIETNPVDGLRIRATSSYNDAHLTTAFPPNGTVTAPAGTQLPYSMHWSGSVTPDWQVAHFGDKAAAFVGGTVSYLGKRPGEFDGQAGFARLYFPAFTTVGVHIGVRVGSWEPSLYVNNLGNVRGLVGGGGAFAEGNTGGYYAQVIQPRTVGFSLSKSFFPEWPTWKRH